MTLVTAIDKWRDPGVMCVLCAASVPYRRTAADVELDGTSLCRRCLFDVLRSESVRVELDELVAELLTDGLA